MKVSFTGPQSSGKTTLMNALTHLGEYRKWSFVKEVTRKVKRSGHEINDTAHDLNLTQSMILSEHLINHQLKGNLFLDRCILDGYIYTKYFFEEGKVNKSVYDYSVYLLNALLPTLDLVLYPDPSEVELEDDGTRSTNMYFRDRIIQLYADYFEKGPDTSDTRLYQPAPEIIILKGPVSERLDTILKHITYDKIR
jgi:nicotinamide riboside kinase